MLTESTLSGGFAREAGAAGGWGALAAALLVGALLGAAATGLARGQLPRAVAPREPTATAREWPARELPREWRWEGPRYSFDHMFRRPRPAPRP